MDPQTRQAWIRLRDGWPSTAASDLRQGMNAHRRAVQANPAHYRDDVNRFLKSVTDSYARLERMKPYIDAGHGDKAAYDRLVRQYEIVAAGLFSEAFEAESPVVVGGALIPVVLIIGAIGFTVVGVVWAVVAWRNAQVLEQQTTLMESELFARVDASRRGTELQQSTLEFPPAQPGPLENVGFSTGAKVGLGALGVTGLLGVGWMVWSATEGK